MRRTLAVLVFSAAWTIASQAPAQDTPLAAPVPDTGSYDPQLSAKEAVMANWELAASGIRAGRIVADNMVRAADETQPFDILTDKALFAFDTMMTRYNAANWVVASGGDLANVDADLFSQALLSAQQECTGECTEERAALVAAFSRGSDALNSASDAVYDQIAARKEGVDRMLMAELLTIMADYLEGGAWSRDFALTDFGRDGEEVSARLVGVLALWRNVEPYVGLQSAEIDGAINAAVEALLRDMRRHARGKEVLADGGEDLKILRAAATTLAGELRRAVALF